MGTLLRRHGRNDGPPLPGSDRRALFLPRPRLVNSTMKLVTVSPKAIMKAAVGPAGAIGDEVLPGLKETNAWGLWLVPGPGGHSREVVRAGLAAMRGQAGLIWE